MFKALLFSYTENVIYEAILLFPFTFGLDANERDPNLDLTSGGDIPGGVTSSLGGRFLI